MAAGSKACKWLIQPISVDSMLVGSASSRKWPSEAAASSIVISEASATQAVSALLVAISDDVVFFRFGVHVAKQTEQVMSMRSQLQHDRDTWPDDKNRL